MNNSHGTWGERIRTFEWDGGIVTILALEPNRRCSWHRHITAYNQFYVISGILGVKTDKGYTTKLNPGQSFTVDPGVYHEFQTYDDPAVIEEIAFVSYDANDIQRTTLGGALDAEKIKETV